MSVIHIMLYWTAEFFEEIELALITMFWNHFTNTSSNNKAIQDVIVKVKQCGIESSVRQALQAHALSSGQQPVYSLRLCYRPVT